MKSVNHLAWLVRSIVVREKRVCIDAGVGGFKVQHATLISLIFSFIDTIPGLVSLCKGMAARLRGPLRLLLLTCPLLALAETRSEPPDLYLDAMQALSEGRQKDARETVSRMLGLEPQHAGAWLDLAILQCGLGNAEAAERLFLDIESRFSPPAGILEVIALQRAQGCRVKQPRVYSRLRLGRGVDSNANQGASNLNFSIGSGSRQLDVMLLPEYAPRRDQFSLLEAEHAQEFSFAGSSGGDVGFVQFQARKNDTESRYDLASLNLGVEHPWRAGGWAWRSVVSAGFVQLGGKLYQQQAQLQLQASPPLALPSGVSFSMLTDWTLINYPTLGSFDANVWQLRGLLAKRTADVQLQASAGYVYDQQLNQRPGGDRNGLNLGLSGQMRLWGEISGSLSWYRQYWNGQTLYSPGLIDLLREQRTDTVRAILTFPTAPQQSLQLEFRELRNNENISIFQYASHLVQLNWQWQLGR